MVPLTLAMFLALFTFAGEILGIPDTGGQMQLGLFASFLFGTICGYKTRR